MNTKLLNYYLSELSGRLEDAKQETEKVKDLNAQVSNELNEIQGDLPFGKYM